MICNSSPLIFLAKIDKLDLLKELLRKITIPSAVKEEVLVEDKLGYISIDNAIKEGWIKVAEPKRVLEIEIGKGENAATSLAKEKNEGLIIDDAAGVKVASNLNVNVIRTTGVILLGVKRKLLKRSEAAKLINKLLDEGYYIAPKYYAQLLGKLGLQSSV